MEPTIITWSPDRRSERRVTRPFATPTEKRARRVHARLIVSARLSEKKKYGQSGTIAAASGRPGSGAPGGPLTGQAIYQITGGAWVEIDTNGSVYNGLEDATVITKTLIVLQNADGTYTAIQQGCT